MRQLRALVALGAAVASLLACGAPQQTEPVSPAGVNAVGAGVTAAAAGVAWAVGGGCRLQGCPYGSYCNQETGFCEVRKCELGCPDGTVCNEGLGRCQARPPAAGPSDRLPQDDKIANPPGSH